MHRAGIGYCRNHTRAIKFGGKSILAAACLATSAAAISPQQQQEPAQFVLPDGYNLIVSVHGVSKYQATEFGWRKYDGVDLASEELDTKRRCGEDAFCVTADSGKGAIVAVADGVGGWAEEGVDPGIVSHRLMALLHNTAVHATAASTPLSMLELAYRRLRSEGDADSSLAGSTTACVARFSVDNGSVLMHAVNVGDSGFIVIRPKEGVKHVMKETYHGTGHQRVPYQLAVVPQRFKSMGAMESEPEEGALATVRLQEGDVIVFGSDGLLDNISPAVEGGWRYYQGLSAKIPQAVSALSKSVLLQAQQGVKVDDITVVVAKLIRHKL